MKKNLIALLISFLSMAIFAGISSADVFYFNDSDVFGGWLDDNPPGYGSVEITKSDTSLDFVVAANQDYFKADPNEPGLTWDKFQFNSLINITTNDITISAAGSWEIKESNPGPYKTFDFLLTGDSIGDSSVDPLRFSINLESISIAHVTYTNPDGWMFAGHLRRIDPDGTSIWLAVGNAPTPVPIPPSVILFGSGLVCLVGIRQKKQRGQA